MRPETNAFREAISLDGIWSCRADPKDYGEAEGWSGGLHDALPIAVPGSWNEQLAEAELMNFVGPLWYQTEIYVPERAAGRHVVLHFGSADYAADVYWDGEAVGRSGPAKLPFTVDLTGIARPGKTGRLTVRVDNRLPEHGPMQRVTLEDYAAEGRVKDEYWPAVRFDFFPYGGLARPVHLCLLPDTAMRAPRIRTGWQGGAGWLDIDAREDVHLSLDGHPVEPGRIEDVTPWSPATPQLYTLTLDLLDEDGAPIDRITRRIGFRSVEVCGRELLLNGEPTQLKGFGKHEDTPFAGRGVNLPALVKDFRLLKWTGANSVRTSHYPYDEAFLDMADEMGILVIPEVFSVNLDFRRTGERDLAAHKESVSTLIARDGHHACVIAWSLANEPGYLGEPEYGEHSGAYWRDLFAHARALDDRPMTVANVQYAGLDDPAFEESDFLSINRYFGWYTEPGQLDRAAARLRETLDTLGTGQAKPVFVSEFGADAVAGMHATTDQMWTEDYQSDLIETYWRVIDAHPACIGGHVWNFADFRTAQHGRRAVMNRKGVFTRERDPKRAAFTLRRLWEG